MDIQTKKVTLVTEIDFWRSGSGCRARGLEMIKALSHATELTVISSGREMPSDNVLIKRLRLPFTHYWLNIESSAPHEKAISQLRPLISNQDAVIFRSHINAFLIKAVTDKTVTYVDVDDLVSEYCETQHKIGITPSKHLTFDEEVNEYGKFDKILLIQSEHLTKLQSYYPLAKLILTPPPIKTQHHIFSHSVKHIGFFASGWHANLDGIYWFLENVWPLIDAKDITLDIYGYICSAITHLPYKNVRLMGSTTNLDSVYGNIDIAVNPVRYGSGIKIKTLESLGNGIPIVATAEGARGLRHLHQKGLFIGESHIEFAAHLNNLINDQMLRKKNGKEGREHIDKFFNMDTCFAPLISDINSIKQ